MKKFLLATAFFTSIIAFSGPASSQPVWKQVSPSPSGGGGGGGTSCYYTNATSCGSGYNLVPGSFTSSAVTHFICCASSVASDNTPGAFDFDSSPNSFDLGDLWTSSINQITSITSASVSVTSNAEFRICEDSSCSTVVTNWSSVNSVIGNNQYLQVRSTAASFPATFSVSVGTFTDSWDMPNTPVYQIFVSGTAYAASSMGGLSGLDAKCQADASGAGLSGTFRAWAAGTSSIDAPNSRFENWGTNRHYEDVSGNRIASSITNSMPENLEYPIAQEADGTSIGGGRVVGNVRLDGGRISGTSERSCASWTNSSAGNGYSGSINTTDGQWYSGSSTPGSNTISNCGFGRRIYCFQTVE